MVIHKYNIIIDYFHLTRVSKLYHYRVTSGRVFFHIQLKIQNWLTYDYLQIRYGTQQKIILQKGVLNSLVPPRDCFYSINGCYKFLKLLPVDKKVN